MELLLVAIGTFGFVGGLSLLFLAPKVDSEEDIIQKRLAAISEDQQEPTANCLSITRRKLSGSRRQTFFSVTRNSLNAIRAIGRTLHQAGYSGERAIRIFWGVCFCSTIAFAAAAFLLASISFAPFSSTLMLVFAAAGVGYLLPHSNVRRKAKQRMLEIRETFPDTLDLLVVCVEAGLGVDNALVKVSEEQTRARVSSW